MTDAPQPVAAIAASVTSDPSVAVASSAGIVSRLTEFVKSHDYRVLAGGIAGGIAVGTLLFVLLMSGGSEETPPTVAQAPVSVAIEDRQVEETEPRADVAAAATSEEQINEPAVTEVRSLKPVAEVAAEVSKEILEENVVAEQPVEIPDDPLDNANEVAAEVNDAAALAAEPAIVGPVDPATTNKESPAEEFTHLAPSTTGPRPSPLLSKLDRRVYKLAFDKMPLRQFAAFISEYGDVPITIDAASLEAAKIESPLVSIKQSDPSTLAEVMKKTLAGLRLSYEARDGAIVIFAPLPTT